MSEVQSDLIVRRSSDLAQLAELERILLTDEQVEVVDDPAEMSKEIVAQLLGAETDEELESFGDAVGWRDLQGVPMEIHNFRWRPSDFMGEGGASVYFVVEATRLDEGARVVLTTGSRNVLAQLTNLAKRGRIPGAVRMLTKAEKATRAGFYPLWLQTPPGYDQAAADEGDL
jgi:hypothetical protein